MKTRFEQIARDTEGYNLSDNPIIRAAGEIIKKGLRKRTCTCCGAIDEEEIDSSVCYDIKL